MTARLSSSPQETARCCCAASPTNRSAYRAQRRCGSSSWKMAIASTAWVRNGSEDWSFRASRPSSGTPTSGVTLRRQSAPRARRIRPTCRYPTSSSGEAMSSSAFLWRTLKRSSSTLRHQRPSKSEWPQMRRKSGTATASSSALKAGETISSSSTGRRWRS